MTVSSSTNRVSYSGNGTLTVFAYTFKVFDQDDLTVILRASDGTETVQTISTHYSVSGVGDAGGGNVTFVTAPASGVTVVILREQPLTQGLDLVANDPFPAASLEEALDKLVFMSHKHEEELGRTIKASKTNTLAGSEFTISASDRANKVFSFDSNGDLAVTQELGVNRGNWAADTAYNERDIVRDTSDGSIYIVNSAHTSSGSEPLDTNTNSSKYDVIFDVGDMVLGSFTANTITATGLTVTGNTTLGNSLANDIVTVSDTRFRGDILPTDQTGEYDIGQSTRRWNAYLEDVNAVAFTNTIRPKVNEDINLGATSFRFNNAHIALGRFGANAESTEVQIDHNSIYTSSGDMKVEAPTGAVHLIARPGDSVTNSTSHVVLDTNSSAIQFKHKGTFKGSVKLVGSKVELSADTNKHITLDDTAGENNVKVHTAIELEDDADITGDLTVGGDATITGNLTVSGTTTTISTETVQIADNIMVLNHGFTGAASEDAGIEIERGTDANKTFKWREDTDKWSIGDNTFEARRLELTDAGIEIDSESDNTTSTTIKTIDTFSTSDFDGGKYLIVASDGTDTQTTEILFTHDGSTVTSTQYGNVRTGSSDLATYTLDISASTFRLRATAAAATSTDYKIMRMVG